MGSGCLLPGGDGDLDLTPRREADSESLLLRGTFCVLPTQGDVDLSLDLPLGLLLSPLIMHLGWDRDQVLLHELTKLGVLEKE